MTVYLGTWVVIVLGTTALTSLVFLWLVGRDHRSGFLVVILGITALGTTVGISGGFSREAAAGQIMSAVLGLMGGLVIYIFSIDRTKGPVASVVVLALALSIFIGYERGSQFRGLSQTYLYWRDHCVATYIAGDLLSDGARFALVDPVLGELCAEIFKKERTVVLDEASG